MENGRDDLKLVSVEHFGVMTFEGLHPEAPIEVVVDHAAELSERSCRTMERIEELNRQILARITPAGDQWVTCCTCGFKWLKGKHGGHSCAEMLTAKLKEHENRIGILQQADDACRDIHGFLDTFTERFGEDGVPGDDVVTRVKNIVAELSRQNPAPAAAIAWPDSDGWWWCRQPGQGYIPGDEMCVEVTLKSRFNIAFILWNGESYGLDDPKFADMEWIKAVSPWSPAALPAPAAKGLPVGEWTPVTESMPDDEITVLVWSESMDDATIAYHDSEVLARRGDSGWIQAGHSREAGTGRVLLGITHYCKEIQAPRP